MFNVFVSTCAVAFRTTHGQNNTRKCDTEGFVPVSSLCGIVGSPSSFIRSLIGRTRNVPLLKLCECNYIVSFFSEDVGYGVYITAGRIDIASE